MAKTTRVKVYRNAEALMNLAERIAARHKELGNTSPLAPLDWANQSPKVTAALEAHRRAKELERQVERAYEERDNLLDSIEAIVKQSRDLLKAIYRTEPRKLGEFGFEVDDTPRAKKSKDKTE